MGQFSQTILEAVNYFDNQLSELDEKNNSLQNQIIENNQAIVILTKHIEELNKRIEELKSNINSKKDKK
ncbi:MAG: hypothetical protein H7836_08195 [Magnetococcus sp. YQC-3]